MLVFYSTQKGYSLTSRIDKQRQSRLASAVLTLTTHPFTVSDASVEVILSTLGTIEIRQSSD